MTTFQSTAALSAAPTTATTSLRGTMISPAMVRATALPNSSGPSRQPTPARARAVAGWAARVATVAATELAPSWKPVVTANASAKATTTIRPVTVSPCWPGRLAAGRRAGQPPIWLIDRAGRMKSTWPMR